MADISEKQDKRLAIFGGEPVRKRPMPPRFALGAAEEATIKDVIEHLTTGKSLDPGYQGEFEKRYTDAFVAQMGGGYADAVATGTAALYVAVAALGHFRREAEVIVSRDHGSGEPLGHYS